MKFKVEPPLIVTLLQKGSIQYKLFQSSFFLQWSTEK